MWNSIQTVGGAGETQFRRKFFASFLSRKEVPPAGGVPFERAKGTKTRRGSAGSRWTGPLAQVHIPALPPVPHGRLNKPVPGLIQGLFRKFPRRGGSAVWSGPSPARASQALPFLSPLLCLSTAKIRRAASFMNISAIKRKKRRQRRFVQGGKNYGGFSFVLGWGIKSYFQAERGETEFRTKFFAYFLLRK